MKGIICVGDTTTHGGQVVSGDALAQVNSRAIACVGDRCTCPIHGDAHIVEGHPHHTLNGKAVAYAGCLTACGAELLATDSTARCLE